MYKVKEASNLYFMRVGGFFDVWKSVVWKWWRFVLFLCRAAICYVASGVKKAQEKARKVRLPAPFSWIWREKGVGKVMKRGIACAFMLDLA